MNAAVSADGDKGTWSDGCPIDLARRLFASKFELRKAYFDPRGDACFCSSCHTQRGDAASYSRGDPPATYAMPVGFSRLGIDVPKAFSEEHNVFKMWHVSYHGTRSDSLVPIFKGGLRLLKAGDVKLGGEAIEIPHGHITRAFKRVNAFTGEEELFDPTQLLFTSPSARYAAHPAYARKMITKHPDKPSRQISMQFVFQVRQRPGSYKIGQETVGARETKLDPLFENNELERYTQEQVGILISGLLIRLSEV